MAASKLSISLGLGLQHRSLGNTVHSTAEVKKHGHIVSPAFCQSQALTLRRSGGSYRVHGDGTVPFGAVI